MLQPFCACFTIFCFCLLSFPRRFYHSRLVLFRSTACFCLISSCVSCCVCHFLRFGFSFLHVILAADTFCYSLFLFIVPFHFSFHAYLLYKRVWAFVGQIMLTRSKGSWAQFFFIRRSYSAEELYSTANLYSIVDLRFAVDCFPCTSFSGPFLLFGLLSGFLGLDFYWAFFLIGF